MNEEEMAFHLKEAFFEGFDSYETNCNAYNSRESAWEKSDIKQMYDTLIRKHNEQ